MRACGRCARRDGRCAGRDGRQLCGPRRPVSCGRSTDCGRTGRTTPRAPRARPPRPSPRPARSPRAGLACRRPGADQAGDRSAARARANPHRRPTASRGCGELRARASLQREPHYSSARSSTTAPTITAITAAANSRNRNASSSERSGFSTATGCTRCCTRSATSRPRSASRSRAPPRRGAPRGCSARGRSGSSRTAAAAVR